jgi:hypothetical protein
MEELLVLHHRKFINILHTSIMDGILTAPVVVQDIILVVVILQMLQLHYILILIKLLIIIILQCQMGLNVHKKDMF